MITAADFEFNEEEWRRLTPSERVGRCRSFADQAKQLCADATPELKVSYLELSQHWLALADKIEPQPQPQETLPVSSAVS